MRNTILCCLCTKVIYQQYKILSLSQWRITMFQITMNFFCWHRKKLLLLQVYAERVESTDKLMSCKMKISSKCCYTKKENRSKLGLSKGLFLCNNDKHTSPLHSECFRKLVESKCDNQYLISNPPNGSRLIVFACGRRYYNSMKKKGRKRLQKIEKSKWIIETNIEKQLVHKTNNASTNNWSSDGSEIFLINYLSEE